LQEKCTVETLQDYLKQIQRLQNVDLSEAEEMIKTKLSSLKNSHGLANKKAKAS